MSNWAKMILESITWLVLSIAIYIALLIVWVGAAAHAEETPQELFVAPQTKCLKNSSLCELAKDSANAIAQPGVLLNQEKPADMISSASIIIEKRFKYELLIQLTGRLSFNDNSLESQDPARLLDELRADKYDHPEIDLPLRQALSTARNDLISVTNLKTVNDFERSLKFWKTRALANKPVLPYAVGDF